MSHADPAADTPDATPPQQRRNTYLQDTIWTLVGNTVYGVATWGVISAIAHLGTPEMVGQYVLAIALISPVVLFTGMQLQTVLATDAKDAYRFGEYFGVRLAAGVAAVLLVAGITAAHADYRRLWLVVAVVLVAKVAESTADVCYGLFQKHHRLDLSGKSRIMRSLLGLLALAGVLWLTGRIAAGLAALALVWIALFFAFDLSRARRFAAVAPTLGAKRAWALTRLGLPLGVALGLLSLQVNIPRYVLERFDGLEVLGFFSAMVFFNVGLAHVCQAACQAASPRLAVHFVHDLRQYVRLVRLLLVVMACAGAAYMAAVLLFGETILTLAYGREYAQYVRLFWVVALFGVVDLFSVVVGYSITAARYFAIQPVLRTGTVAVCLVAVYLLTRAYGMAGAAWGSLIASSFALLAGGATLAVIIRRADSRAGLGTT